MKVRFFDPGKAYLKIKPEIDAEIQRVLAAGDLILRNDVEKFERSLANFVGTRYAVGLNSGTDALLLALTVLGIGAGDEVIVPAHTFVATVQVIVQRGAIPVLVDLGDDWREKRTNKTKAVICVHLAGAVSNWEPDGKIPMIEDACQSIGALGVGQGIIQCWSFYPAKILGAYGDAGAVTTASVKIRDEISELRNHYKRDYSKWGINSRLDNLQAAILNVKIKYLEENIRLRSDIAERYWISLYDIKELTLPLNKEGRVWQDFIIRLTHRDDFFDYMANQGVECMKNEYPFPIPKLPKSLEYERETIRIPCNELLTDGEVEYIIKCIRSFYGK